MKQKTPIYQTCLVTFIATIAMSVIAHAQVDKATEFMTFSKFGNIELFQAVWGDESMRVEANHASGILPGPSPTLKLSETILIWYDEKILVPHNAPGKPELIQKIKSGPAMVIIPKEKPDLKFWITLGDKSPIILVESKTDNESHLYSLPHDKPLDFSFVTLIAEKEKK